MGRTVLPPRGNSADCKQAPGVLQPRIDPNRCEGKGPCVAVCPVLVFEMGTMPKAERSALSLKGWVKGVAHGWKQARLLNPAACQGCGLCVQACPEHAITLVRANSTPAVGSGVGRRQIPQRADR